MRLRLSLPITIIVLFVATLPLVLAAPGNPPVPVLNNAPLHYKSLGGLMPPAYGMAPGDALHLEAVNAATVSFLNPYTTTTVNSWPQVLALADLTGDARADAAVATGSYFDPANDKKLHLFAAQAGDLVSRTQILPAGIDPEAIVATDLNSNGRTDVALALAGENTLALYTQTIGGLANPVSIALAGAPDALAVGNFAGDLYPDLAAVTPLSGTIHLWQSSSQGLTPLPFTLPYPTGGYDALAVGDFNNDGNDDIVALRGAGYVISSVVVYLQSSGFFPVSYTLSPETGGYLPHSLAVGDVNSDGKDDLVVTAGGNTPNAYLNIFLQGTGGLAAAPMTYPAFHLPSAVAIGDLNHDGREDVVVLHDAWQTLSIYTQTVSGTLSAFAVANVPYSDRYRPNALALADLDGNGGEDVALVDRDHGLVILTNTLTAPAAVIVQPAEASVVLPGPLTVTGAASASAAIIEVRLRGLTDWMTATLVGNSWTTSLTLPSLQRAWWIEARAIDAQGHVQAPVARRRIGVEDGPPQGQIIINNGAYATNQSTVTLMLPAYDVGGVTEMRFSLDGIFYTDWMTYSLTYTWTFASGDGLKTLYVQFRDVDDNVSALASDSILLDTIPPTSMIATFPLTVSQASITLTWTGADSVSGIAFYDIQVKDVGVGDWNNLLVHTLSNQTVIQAQDDHTYCFRSRATDRAGNVEAWPAGNGDTCTTILLERGVELMPPSDSRIAYPGQVVTYTMSIENTGVVADSYDISLGTHTWQVLLSDTQVGTVSPGEVTRFIVYVTVPGGAHEGDYESLNVVVASQSDPATHVASLLTTTATTRVITREVEIAPHTAVKVENPGKVVTYTLHVENTGNTTDSYDLSLGVHTWVAHLSRTYISLEPGEMASFEVYVAVPDGVSEGDEDVVDVIVTSRSDANIHDTSTLATAATLYTITRGVTVAPHTAIKDGIAGSVVRYTMLVTNTCSVTDIVTLISSGNVWSIAISPNDVSLSSLGQATIVVSVTIPITATVETSDTVNILATATGASDSATLTTTVSPVRIYLPVVTKGA